MILSLEISIWQCCMQLFVYGVGLMQALTASAHNIWIAINVVVGVDSTQRREKGEGRCKSRAADCGEVL